VEFVTHLRIANHARLDAAKQRRFRISGAAPEGALTVGQINKTDFTKPDV
jgi:hypothetical protein